MFGASCSGTRKRFASTAGSAAKRLRVPLLLACAVALGRAETIVTLPTYTVKEPRLLPKAESWRYGQVPGFEILSDASDGETKELIRVFLLFQRAVGAVWPAVKRHFALPVSLILCSNAKRFVPFAPASLTAPPASTYSLSLRERELAAII